VVVERGRKCFWEVFQEKLALWLSSGWKNLRFPFYEAIQAELTVFFSGEKN
jgi:hypothetical protein